MKKFKNTYVKNPNPKCLKWWKQVGLYLLLNQVMASLWTYRIDTFLVKKNVIFSGILFHTFGKLYMYMYRNFVICSIWQVANKHTKKKTARKNSGRFFFENLPKSTKSFYKINGLFTLQTLRCGIYIFRPWNQWTEKLNFCCSLFVKITK